VIGKRPRKLEGNRGDVATRSEAASRSQHFGSGAVTSGARLVTAAAVRLGCWATGIPDLRGTVLAAAAFDSPEAHC
jgi:hypothetical protein